MTCCRSPVRVLRLPWGRGGHEARFVSFVCLGGGSHEARFVSFVCQPYEADSYAFSTGVGQAVGKRRIGISRLHHTRTAGIAARVAGHEARLVSFVSSLTKESVVLLWLDLVDRDEAPSRPFSEASLNGSEGASVAFMAFTAEIWCVSDHESPACALRALKVTKAW